MRPFEILYPNNLNRIHIISLLTIISKFYIKWGMPMTPEKIFLYGTGLLWLWIGFALDFGVGIIAGIVLFILGYRSGQ